MDTFTPYQALKKMRQLTECGITFSITFFTCSTSKGTIGTLKHVNKALLRQGLRKENGIKSSTLIAYTDCETNTPRFFNLPLIIKLNEINIKA